MEHYSVGSDGSRAKSLSTLDANSGRLLWRIPQTTWFETEA